MTGKLVDSRLRVAYNTISSLNQKAYKDIYLLSNLVLSKTPFGNRFLTNFLSDGTARDISSLTIIKKFIRYYLASFFHFALYITKFLIYRIEGQAKEGLSNVEELIVIDTYFLVDKIIESNRYEEFYFPGLGDVLERLKKKYVILPVFEGNRGIGPFRSLIKVIKDQRVPLLCEYHLLTFKDLLRLSAFILAYPWHVARFARSLEGGGDATRLIRYELFDTLDHVTFSHYSRYLQGRRISMVPCRKIKLISWYENQALDKNLYKGIRTSGKDITIYGAQLFLHSRMSLNVVADENERMFDVVPDRIVVNGPVFADGKSTLDYRVGPSLRYGKLFKMSVRPEEQEDILVLLPYSLEIARGILKILSEADRGSHRFVIKTHPTTNLSGIEDLIKPGWIVCDKNIYEQFNRTRVVIGSSSGSLVEAVVLGIPVIQLNIQGMLDFEMLPDSGKGIIWEEASNGHQLYRSIEVCDERLKKDAGKVRETALLYRGAYFCEPTEQKIKEVFEI